MLPLILGAVGAGVSAISGITNAVQAGKAKKQQQQAMDKANQLAEQQMQFMQGQMEQWNSVFGDTQALLADYYNNLSPEKRIAQGFESLESQYNQASKRVNQTLAQRGLAGSGADAQANTDLLMSLAKEKSKVEQNAEAQVAQERLGFFNMGQQQKNFLLSGMNNAMTNAQNQNMNMAGVFGNQAQHSALSATSAFGSIGDVLGSAAALGMKQDQLGGGGKGETTNTTGSSNPDWFKQPLSPSLVNNNPLLTTPYNPNQFQEDYKPIRLPSSLPIA